MIIVRVEQRDSRTWTNEGLHLECDLQTAKFIVDHLPRRDTFTDALHNAIRRAEDEREHGDRN